MSVFSGIKIAGIFAMILAVAGCATKNEDKALDEQPVASSSDSDDMKKDCSTHFQYDSAQVSDEEASNIQKCGSYSGIKSSSGIVVEGYASPDGGSAYNMALSQKRAAAVAEELKKFYTGKISVVGKGEVEVEDPSQYPENRRADIVIAGE